jgi:hypothetical protein
MLAHIGRLARQRRGDLGFTGRIPFAQSIGIGEASLKTFELGHTEPNPHNKAKIETGLFWKPGIISDVLDWADDGRMGPAEVDMPYLDGRDLELLTEVIRRLERYRDVLDDPPAVVTPAQEQWQKFGFAALHDVSTPKTGKN